MTHHVVESTSELSALMKAGVMAGSERDAGFCSGGDEDDMSGLHSPSASEDSVEVQVTPISLRNKRKLAEPRKIQEPSSAPLKKRRFERIEECVIPDEEFRMARSPSPFRPWSTSSKTAVEAKGSATTVAQEETTRSTVSPFPTNVLFSSASTPSNQDERNKEHGAEIESQTRDDLTSRLRDFAQTRSLRNERRESSRQKLVTTESNSNNSASSASATTATLIPATTHPRLQEEPLSLVLRGEISARVPSHPAVNGSYERTCSIQHVNATTSHHFQNYRSSGDAVGDGGGDSYGYSSTATSAVATSTLTANAQQTCQSRQHSTAGQQRNYKNMTRERRIEANARERTRVHTISAAFDTLRRAIPAYSHNQKLSKLSVLRIACSYIMTLGKIVNTPEGEPTNGAPLGACVDLVSRTIQTEGKLRKRKED